MVRVISGLHRGNRLAGLPGNEIRPTTDKTKEWIFNVLGDIEGIKVLDLFAGTGSLGIEALSRGADRATFVEVSQEAIGLIRKNVAKLGEGDRAILRRKDSLKFLAESKTERWDLIFADPPYSYDKTAELTSAALMAIDDGGYFVLETPAGGDIELPAQADREKKFGGSMIYLFGSKN
ncbi:MAG: 16S rRNA (guanine(966)-N(2))-methyltransferase RsmD [Candidatus Marinimicrobia bacterium]|nr:16S rRNA (guanine(966)-N(2))-methyltransferase RsmD [Candidatus Neomarinimicrobiota bacterium]